METHPMPERTDKQSPPYSHIKVLPAEIKAISEEDGARYIEGLASTPDVDETREVVKPEAFTDGLPQFMKHPVLSYVHDWQWPIGHVETAEVVDAGLQIRARLLNAGDDLTDRVWARVEQDAVKALSIGFDGYGTEESPPGYLDEDSGAWVWERIQLREIAIVPMPANYEATMQIAKGLGLDLSLPLIGEAKGVVPFQDLSLAPEDREWDAGEARKRIREWAGGDETDWAKYRKAFVWYDAENAETVGAYKLAIADVIDGGLKVVWRAVAAAMAVMHGARGGADIPDADNAGVVSHLERYYKKFDKEPPEKASEFRAGEQEIYEETEFAENLSRLRGLSLSTSNIATHWVKEGRFLMPDSRVRIEEARDALDTVLQADATARGDGVLPVPVLRPKPIPIVKQ